jgi:hypothetical protein
MGGRIAWLPRASFKLPNYGVLDLRLAKQITIRERFNVELRAEMFNALNSTLILDVDKNAYTYASLAASTSATPTPACWNGLTTSGTGPAAGTMAHANTCMVPVTTFQQPITTTGNLLGSRQVQFGARFNF